jgi:hypothetical protein
MPPSSDIAAFRNVLQRSKRIIIVAGAGLSAASGLCTIQILFLSLQPTDIHSLLFEKGYLPFVALVDTGGHLKPPS